MLKFRHFLVLITTLFLIVSTNCNDDIFPQKKDVFREPMIDFRPLKSHNNKHSELTDLATKLNKPRTLQQNDNIDDEDSFPSPHWNSNLTLAERNAYRKMINLKDSFASSLPYLPQFFQPENPIYLQQVFLIMVDFFYFAGAVSILILIYLILRFCLKKCVGPIKMSKVTRSYRNLTWALLVGSIIAIVTIFAFVLIFSFKINAGINSVATNVINSTETIYLKQSQAINNLTVYLQANSQNLIDVPLEISQDNLDTMNSGLALYYNNTITRINDLTALEDKRNLFIILTFTFYLLITFLSFVGNRRRWPGFILLLSVVLLLTLPILIAFSGFLASHYFIQADFCENVYDAIYNDYFPVYDRRIGYYISCFSASTKSSLYAFKWELDSYEDQITQMYGNGTSNQEDFIVYSNIINQIDNVRTNSLNDLIGCKHVYENIIYAETNFCKQGMNWTYSLVISISWLFLIILLCAYAVNRTKPLIEKRKHEIESMLNNEQAAY